MSETFVDVREARGDLTFDWKRSGRRPFWLLFFILLSSVGHVACFYLFRVVYPPQQRELVRAVEVTILDPSDLPTRRVLARIDDRVVALDSCGTPESLAAITGSGTRFSPFFEGFLPELRELPRFELEPSIPFFPPGNLFLPPIDSANRELPSKVSAAPFKPVASIRWEVSNRQVLRDFEWTPVTEVQRPVENDESLFYIGIDRFGQVVHALPEQSAGALMDAFLLTSLRQMRFSPVKYRVIDWAWVTVRW
jgi:hypothetical protein